MNHLVIFGIGEFAELADYYFTNDSSYEVVAFTVDKTYRESDSHLGRPLVDFEDLHDNYPPEKFMLFIAIGYTLMNTARRDKYAAAKSKGYQLASYISSRTSTWNDLIIGDNCFVMEGNQIQPFVTIGNNVVIWCNTLVSHHTRIKDHCFVTSNVVISGGVTVGEESFIGINAALREHIKLGARNLVGAGALILRDTKDNEAFMVNGTIAAPMTSQRLCGML